MMIAGQLGNPAAGYTCSTTGVCSGSPLFFVLQQELNRVRKVYGLPADVTVDGKIGTSTLAKLIKTAQKINSALGEKRDSALDDYVYPDIAQNLTPKMLAYEAAAIVGALRRNGYDIRYLPPDQQTTSLLDPYVNNLDQGSSAKTVSLPGWAAGGRFVTVAVGPTSPTAPTGPTVFPIATGMPKGLKIAGLSLLGLALGGAITAGIMALRNR